MNELTAEQIAIIQPVMNELDERFFDMAGRLNEREYFGEFAVEAYKAALFIHRDNKLPQYLVYKHIRQHWLSLGDFAVAEEYNMMNRSVIFGMNLVEESILKK